jgi:AraC-like DNA-binding protein
MDSVPARAVGEFRHWSVTTAGHRAFSSIWAHRLPENGAAPIAVASDGTIDLQWIGHAFRVAGPDREAVIEDLPAGALVIGFRFRPAAAAAWLGIAACEIADQRPELEALWGTRARRAAMDVADERNIDRLVRSLQAVVGRMAPEFESADQEMRAAYGFVAAGASPSTTLVPWLGRALGISERTLRRRFEEIFGYGPKTLDRILRYQRYLRLAEKSSESTAILAVEAGYSDQAHLVRESRRLTGSTPRQLARLSRAQSDMPAAFSAAGMLSGSLPTPDHRQRRC